MLQASPPLTFDEKEPPVEESPKLYSPPFFSCATKELVPAKTVDTGPTLVKPPPYIVLPHETMLPSAFRATKAISFEKIVLTEVRDVKV